MKPLRSRYPYLAHAIVVLVAVPAYFFALQTSDTAHFGIGRLDRTFLAEPEAFYPPSRMSGPVRLPDGSVEVRELVGRLTKTRARFRLPYHALASPLELHVRCHRFGLEGVVSITVNGEHLEDLVFAEGSYPWAGIRTVVPEGVAETGPLQVELAVRDGNRPPEHLPADLGLGVDWIDVTPMSRGVVLVPTIAQWAQLALFVISAALFFRFLRMPVHRAAAALLASTALFIAGLGYEPILGSQLARYAWLPWPGCMVLVWLAERFDRPVSQ